jgi:hypothetical protein
VPTIVSGPEVPTKLAAHTFTTPNAGNDNISNVATVIASAVIVIGFVVFALLFEIFLANNVFLFITMLILSISLKIMQIDSVRL